MKPHKNRFSDNRLSRAEFAAYCLPATVALLLMMLLIGGMLDASSGTGRYLVAVLSLNIKRSLTGFILVGCVLVFYQHKLLIKRCNDAGLGWPAGEILAKLGFFAAALGFLLRPLGLLVLGLVFAQYLYGLYLRDNPLPNLSGNPRTNSNLMLLLAGASYLIAVGLVLVSAQWLEAWCDLVYQGLQMVFWRLL
ncbi:MAG: hypothetical protein Q4C79_05005 [Neisseria sp.]|uniref:hypothetical protein n=1 Tax=Neisseria sp. TaxID=192066 RepID=UPI0026DD9DF6|nr:hypothetical protein [Neisseria sp.]MDO4248308.1 hypothetical protein [Neisseria sp.]